MARSLQDKLATLFPVRRARIVAEAERLQKEYLNQQPPQNDAERSDEPSAGD